METINVELFRFLNRPIGGTADWIALVFTDTGYTFVAFPIALVAMWIYGGLNRRNIWLLVTALLVGGIVVTGIKELYVKDRPLGYFGEISEAEKAKVHAPFQRLRHRTFPSGHSQTAFSVATVMVLLFRRHTAWWLLWASLVALSRVRLGLHFPFDILAGSAWGALSAYIVFRLFEWKRPVDGKGAG